MQTNLLFRGISKETDEYVYGGYCHWDDIVDDGKDSCDYIVVQDNNASGVFKFVSVYPETVGQWTGYYDKTRKKMFVGDIILEIGHMGPQAILFEDGQFKVNVPTIPHNIVLQRGEDKEVIGTVHDHMLKSSDDSVKAPRRYIDADKFIRSLQDDFHGAAPNTSLYLHDIIHRVDTFESADVVPKKKG